MGKVAKSVRPVSDDGPDLPESPNPDLENSVITFVSGVLEKMGYPATVTVAYRKERKLGLNIDSEYSSIIIGRKGKILMRSIGRQCVCRQNGQ